MRNTPPPTRPPPSSAEADLRKPHEMIVLVPRSKRVTLTGRRVYNALLQVAQDHMAILGDMPLADHLFEAPLPAILRCAGSSGEDRTAAKRYLREMRGLEVDWTSTAPGDGLKWRAFSMLSEVAIELRNGENWVRWSFPPTLMAALRNPTLWARIELDMLARLGTYTAVALYEICARYRGNPSGVTSRQAVDWWIDALSGSPPGTERREWRKFKNERVKEAVDEINRETDLEIELKEDKGGSRAVLWVQFAVREKRQAPRAGQGRGPVDAGLVLQAAALGIREIKLDGLVSEFGDEAVRTALALLKERMVRQKLSPVENSYSYLRSLLRNGAQPGDAALAERLDASAVAGGRGAADGAGGAAPAATAPLQAQAPAPAGQAAHLPRSVGPAAAPARTAASPQDWLASRIAGLKAEIAALDPLQRQLLVDRALAELSARKLLTPVIARRAAQGDVLHAVLGSVVVRLYATDRFGAGWDQPEAGDAGTA